MLTLLCGLQVSAGFDAHWRDPLAGLQFRTSTFHYLAAQVKQLAEAIAGELSQAYCVKGLTLNTFVHFNGLYTCLSYACH